MWELIHVRGTLGRSFRKSVNTYALLGLWLVTADEIATPDTLDFELKVNGKSRQASNTSHLLLGVDALIEFASSHYAVMP